ncbi:ATM interactor [Toxorhynchites rutilus septentrionalis]|uniref:ATM interactor n=1 Tax=Toxorhynchites rutilus septentrionalis TaxID=329112 RepID=UPI00247906BC|nr:ATM interactor [Toxorhynchites rutilus septentrionalis]
MTEQRMVIKLTLSPEEIVETKLHRCCVEGCSESFTNVSHLQLHLTKRHKLTTVNVKTDKTDHVKYFHCPEQSCVYHVRASGEKFFTSFRSLKQHFLKMHSEKKFVCNHCDGKKSFATESLLRAHQTNCGQLFVCKVCRLSYESREALLTHCRRKSHGYEELLADKLAKRKVETQKPKSVKRLKKPSHMTIMVEAKLPVLTLTCKKSQMTQTDLMQSEDSIRSESSTQTKTTEFNPATMDSFCQTNQNLPDYPYNAAEEAAVSTDPQYQVTSSETQTDQIYETMFPNEDRSDPMLYSNMYTQTCEDIFSDLELASIETQTNWDGLGEFLVSAETQTNVDVNGAASSSELSRGKISSIQTQTSASMEFLNAISSESSSIHTQTS